MRGSHGAPAGRRARRFHPGSPQKRPRRHRTRRSPVAEPRRSPRRGTAIHVVGAPAALAALAMSSRIRIPSARDRSRPRRPIRARTRSTVHPIRAKAAIEVQFRLRRILMTRGRWLHGDGAQGPQSGNNALLTPRDMLTRPEPSCRTISRLPVPAITRYRPSGDQSTNIAYPELTRLGLLPSASIT
jgi:hypothetical protein